jgi:sugar phosphate permease
MDIERSTMRKVYWRLLPLTILVYFLCYLDRINVGFAALTMNKDLGLDAATYGMAPALSSGVTSCSKCRATSSWKSSARASGSPASW